MLVLHACQVTCERVLCGEKCELMCAVAVRKAVWEVKEGIVF